MLVTDRVRAHLPLPDLACRAAAGGVDAIQIREKDLDSAELLALVESVKDGIGDRAAILVNGDPEVAEQAGVGLHLPESGIAPAMARAVLGPEPLIGRSIHRPPDAADIEGADYLIAGHVFSTASHPGSPPLGVDGLAAIIAASAAPVLAIGGINESNIDVVMRAGAHGVAVISAINSADDPESAARRLRQRIDQIIGTDMPSTENTKSATVTLHVNGKPEEVAEGATITDFLAAKTLQAKLVVVELNGTILRRADFDSTILRAGDQIEVVHFVGGG
jgi:thiamine-phosphate pyrophosphorylase